MTYDEAIQLFGQIAAMKGGRAHDESVFVPSIIGERTASHGNAAVRYYVDVSTGPGGWNGSWPRLIDILGEDNFVEPCDGRLVIR